MTHPRALGLLLTAAAIAPGCGSGPPEPAHRLLVVGWDGATFDLIDPLLAQGRLPNVARLLARGSSARLASTIIPISSAAWVGAVTGKGPGQTGVYSFFEPIEDSYDVQVISSLSNRAAPIWRILSARGIGVHVMGVPITYPPETVQGTMIAGMLSPFDADYAYPRELTASLRDRGFEPDLGIWREAHGPTPKRLETQLKLKREIALEQLGRDDWEFSMIVFKSLDVVSHGIYSARTDGQVAMLLERLDGILGDMLDAVGDETNVLLMSDHGFRTYPQAMNVHTWMIEQGFSPKRADPGQVTIAPGDLATTRPREHQRRIGELDLSQTVAFAAACEGNFGSIRLNLAGREPHGIVAPDDADRVLGEIIGRLKEQQADGAPVVERVLFGHELYPGPESDRIVPDLLFETREDIQVVARPDRPPFERFERPFPDHARDGILICAGPDIESRPAALERPRYSVLDIAPTALHLLHLPVVNEMDGLVRVEMLRPGAPVRRLDEADDPLWPRAGDTTGLFESERSGDTAETEERLKALGYTE